MIHPPSKARPSSQKWRAVHVWRDQRPNVRGCCCICLGRACEEENRGRHRAARVRAVVRGQASIVGERRYRGVRASALHPMGLRVDIFELMFYSNAAHAACHRKRPHRVAYVSIRVSSLASRVSRLALGPSALRSALGLSAAAACAACRAALCALTPVYGTLSSLVKLNASRCARDLRELIVRKAGVVRYIE